MPADSPRTPSLATSRHAQMAEAFELLALGLGPFVDSRMGQYFSEELSWEEAASNRMGRATEHGAIDPLFQLLVIRRFWGPVFAKFYGEDLRGLVGQLIEARNLWAHLNLPDDTAYLDRILLSVERLVAPVDPDNLTDLRRLRGRLHNPITGDTNDEAVDLAPVAELEAQLAETEQAFGDLQENLENLTGQLELSRRAAANKQLRISTIEAQLQALNGYSRDLQGSLADEKEKAHRLEWLFVALITSLLLVMVLLAGVR